MSPRLEKGLAYFNQRFHHMEKGSNSVSNMLPTLNGKWKIASLPPPSIQLQPTLYRNGVRLNGFTKILPYINNISEISNNRAQ